MNDAASITTPNPGHALRPSLLRRGAARAVDAALLGLAGTLVGSLTGFGPWWLLGTALTTYGYFVVADAVGGATLGKRLTRLRVVDADGEPPALGAAARRELFVLVGAVPFAGPVLALAAAIAIAKTATTDAHGRAFHDRAAGGTAVVLSPVPVAHVGVMAVEAS